MEKTRLLNIFGLGNKGRETVDRKSAPIVDTKDSISYLGVRLEKATNPQGKFVPRIEQYRDYINDEFSLELQRQIAVSFLQGDPILIEGGTSIGKTTAVRKMAAELGWEIHYANLNGATDVEDLMGRYIPNPNKHSESDPEYIFADGKVTSGLRQEEGKVKVIILDEFNSAAPNILIRLHEVLDALGRGEDVVLSEDASEVVAVDRDKTKIVALMNPPGKGYFGREPLDPAQLRRWVYTKVPTDLPEKTFNHATDALFTLAPNLQPVPESLYLLSRDLALMPEELGQIPGIKEILTKYKEFHRSAKQLVKERRVAADQPQPFTYDDRMEPRRVRDFVLAFYNGDINETFQAALRYYYSNKLDSAIDKSALEELIRHVEYIELKSGIPTKRRGLWGESNEHGKETWSGERFTAEQRMRLQVMGYSIFRLSGKSVNELIREGLVITDRIGNRLNEHPVDWRSRSGDVAIRIDKPYLANSNGQTSDEHKHKIEEHSDHVARIIPGTQAVLGSAGDYIELAKVYKDETGKNLFVAEGVFAATSSKVKDTNGVKEGVVGSFAGGTLGIAKDYEYTRSGHVYSMPLVVPGEP